MIPSVELVIGLVGSTIGIAICIMFPAACFRKIIKKDTTERYLAQFIVISGFCLMILGTYANLSAIDEKSSGTHLDIPKTNEDLLKPTEFIKDSIDEKIKSIEKALEEKDKENEMVESNRIGQSMKETEQKEYFNQTKTVKNEKPSPPPLPVDEPHSAIKKNEIVAEKLVKIEPQTNAPEILSKVFEDVKKLSNSSGLKDVEKQILDKKTTASVLEIQPQTIDNDAIKKDEEVAKEEYKQDNEELEKTQKELEKTKNLLEKKVEEIKEELVKQNQETQNLVAEKLDEVVQKFEAIERKVQKQNKQAAPLRNDAENVNEQIKDSNNFLNVNNDTNNIKPNKGSLISILTENRNLNNKPVSTEKDYETLSYKTGKLMEHAKNDTILEKRLPIPLALLINTSQAKMNETLHERSQIRLRHSLDNQNKTQEKYIPPLNITQHKDSEKFKLDTIRRDILQLKSNPEEITTTATNVIDNLSVHRNKRSYQPLEVNGNCLNEPKVGNLIAAGVSSGLEMKIGRELKSIRDEK